MEEGVAKRIGEFGIRSAHPVELAALAFSKRPDDADLALNEARELLRDSGRLQRLEDLSSLELQTRFGLSNEEALQRLAALEIGRRVGLSMRGSMDQANDPESAFHAVEHLRSEKQEHFYVLTMDAKNSIIRKVRVHSGTLTMSVVGPREVFREALKDGAASIIVAHNHPSGDPTPSEEDLAITRKLAAVGETLDIPLLDHLIVGNPGYVSFRKMGYL